MIPKTIKDNASDLIEITVFFVFIRVPVTVDQAFLAESAKQINAAAKSPMTKIN